MLFLWTLGKIPKSDLKKVSDWLWEIPKDFPFDSLDGLDLYDASLFVMLLKDVDPVRGSLNGFICDSQYFI